MSSSGRVVVLGQGKKTFWRIRTSVDVTLVEYLDSSCVEVIAHDPIRKVQFCRLYLSKTVLMSIVDMEEEMNHSLKQENVGGQRQDPMGVRERMIACILDRLEFKPASQTLPNSSGENIFSLRLREEFDAVTSVIEKPAKLRPISTSELQTKISLPTSSPHSKNEEVPNDFSLPSVNGTNQADKSSSGSPTPPNGNYSLSKRRRQHRERVKARLVADDDTREESHSLHSFSPLSTEPLPPQRPSTGDMVRRLSPRYLLPSSSTGSGGGGGLAPQKLNSCLPSNDNCDSTVSASTSTGRDISAAAAAAAAAVINSSCAPSSSSSSSRAEAITTSTINAITNHKEWDIILEPELELLATMK